jgi:hypothetical protein
LNLKTFAMVNEAISRMNMGDNNAASDKERKHSKTGNLYSPYFQPNAPLAAPEEEDAAHTNGDSSGGEHHHPTGNGGYMQFRDDFGSVASNLFTSCYAPAHSAKVKGHSQPPPPQPLMPAVPKVKNSMLRQLAARRRDLSEQQSKLLDIGVQIASHTYIHTHTLTFESFHVEQAKIKQKCHHGSGISILHPKKF